MAEHILTAKVMIRHNSISAYRSMALLVQQKRKLVHYLIYLAKLSSLGYIEVGRMITESESDIKWQV